VAQLKNAGTGLKVVRPGILSLLQDSGRFGVAHQALCQGGPMDEHAFCWANLLLGNPMHSPVVEIAIGQACFEAQSELTVALTGADLDARIDDRPCRPWRSYRLRAGQQLRFLRPVSGLRAYLAVAGGFEAPHPFGSAACVPRDRLGGLDGGPLKAGDLLASPEGIAAPAGRQTPPRFVPDYREPLRLRLIPGYQYEQFDAKTRAKLLEGEYRIANQSDRMGCRLEGEPLPGELGGVISEGIALGAVQVPADGQPIILLRDRQTLGGYPKIGCVCRRDLSALAQRPPGTPLRFEPITLKEASHEWLAFARFFNL